MTADAIAPRAAYLDSSAVIKLVVAEPETLALRTAILEEAWDVLVSSALARTEVLRAVAVADSSQRTMRRARAVLDAMLLQDVDGDVLEAAAIVAPASVRSLDALHIATASLNVDGRRTPVLPDGIVALVSYDQRMLRAWRAAQPVPGRAPGASFDQR